MARRLGLARPKRAASIRASKAFPKQYDAADDIFTAPERPVNDHLCQPYVTADFAGEINAEDAPVLYCSPTSPCENIPPSPVPPQSKKKCPERQQSGTPLATPSPARSLNFSTLNAAFEHSQSPMPSNFSLSAAQQPRPTQESHESPAIATRSRATFATFPSQPSPSPSPSLPLTALAVLDMGYTNDRGDLMLPSTPAPLNLNLDAYITSKDLLESYQDQGVTELFPWQADCLEQYAAAEQRNLIYSAPTSAGKTLVAEVLLARLVTAFDRPRMRSL